MGWLVAGGLAAWAGFVETIPNPRQLNQGWVSDTADVLQPAAEQRINQAIDALKRRNGAEMAVVTLKTLPPDQTARQVATELFHAWGIGEKGRDNGLLFLVAVGNRRTEVETGYGTEAVLNDAKVGRILAQQVIPKFRAGDLEGGIVAGSLTFAEAMAPMDKGANPNPSHPVTNLWPWTLLTGLGAALLGWLAKRNGQCPLELTPTGFHRTSRDPLAGGFRSLSAAAGVLLMCTLIGALLSLLQGSPAAWLLIFLALVLTGSSMPWLMQKSEAMVVQARGQQRLVRCKTCGTAMQAVDAAVVAASLSPQESAAQKRAGVRFEGWRCPRCHPAEEEASCSRDIASADFHLIAWEQPGPYSRCPQCRQKAVVVWGSRPDQLLEAASGQSVLRITKECLACGHHWEIEIALPSSDNSDHGGGSGGSGGGGDFGGGSSGGGGAGSSW